MVATPKRIARVREAERAIRRRMEHADWLAAIMAAITRSGLRGTDRAVAATIATIGGQEPSAITIGAIADGSGFSARAIAGSLDRLIAAGWVIADRAPGRAARLVVVPGTGTYAPGAEAPPSTAPRTSARGAEVDPPNPPRAQHHRSRARDLDLSTGSTSLSSPRPLSPHPDDDPRLQPVPRPAEPDAAPDIGWDGWEDDVDDDDLADRWAFDLPGPADEDDEMPERPLAGRTATGATPDDEQPPAQEAPMARDEDQRRTPPTPPHDATDPPTDTPPPLPDRLRAALRAAGLTTASDLEARTPAELAAIPGVGRKSVARVEAWLAALTPPRRLREPPPKRAPKALHPDRREASDLWAAEYERRHGERYPWAFTGQRPHDGTRTSEWAEMAQRIAGTAWRDRLSAAIHLYFDEVEGGAAWPIGEPPTTWAFTRALGRYLARTRPGATTSAAPRGRPMLPSEIVARHLDALERNVIDIESEPEPFLLALRGDS